MKRPLIVANWKMNPQNSKDAFNLAGTITGGVKKLALDIVFCVPFVYIPQLVALDNVFIGAQDCFWEQNGAFTGEISAKMLRNLGCSYVILGHSERRKYLGETVEMIQKKVKAALKEHLIPIICIGEDIEKEISLIFEGVTSEEMKHLVLTFEPEWAISTQMNSKPASRQEVKDAIGKMRTMLVKMFDERVALETPILYGGTVNSSDVQRYIDKGVTQGVLVGDSSLDPKEFIALAKKLV